MNIRPNHGVERRKEEADEEYDRSESSESLADVSKTGLELFFFHVSILFCLFMGVHGV